MDKKLKTQEFLLNGPDVSPIYFDFLSGPFYHKTSFIFFHFIQCEAWGKVLESVSRQARLQRVLRQRLRNPWTQLKYSIRLNFSTWRFFQKLHGVSSRGQKVPFFHLVRVDGWMDVIVFFVHDFFHTVERIEMKLKTNH